MKKNFSVIKTLALLFTAGAIVTACTNDELVEPSQTAKTYTLTVNAVSAGANGTTRALSLDGKTLNAAWATDESVYVTYEGGSALQGTLHPSSNGTSTILKGSLNSWIQVGNKLSLTYPCETINYRGQVGTLEDISARYSFATATATVTSINSAEGKMVADNGEGGPVIFENRQAIVKFSLVDKATGEALSASKLFVKVDNEEYDVTPEAPASELFVAIPGISGKDVTLNATVGDDAYTYEQKGVTFENSRYYAVTVKMTKAVAPNPEDDAYRTPLTFEAKEPNSKLEIRFVGLSGASPIEYSIDGVTWNTYYFGEDIILEHVGDKVSLRGEKAWTHNNAYFSINSGALYFYGNIMSLLSSTDFATATEFPNYGKFSGMFRECYRLYNHPEKKLVLPATKLTAGCYGEMFRGCTNLTEAPELPATTLGNYCYSKMFINCTSLTKAPKLPATTLVTRCYEYMFSACSNLTEAPELPATTLVDDCYSGMFQNCTSLTKAPELPATTLAESCYSGMFRECTSLTEAPELPATTLANYCYSSMFSDCYNLTEAPELPATTLALNCYVNMFQNCTNLTKAPELPATTLAGRCYSGMFQNCTSLTKAPELPATTLAGLCYDSMFQNCTSLTEAPELPATTLANYCYSSMFSDCYNLTEAPELPATTLANGCYNHMFYKCGNLTEAPELPATTLANDCYTSMFYRCSKLNKVKCLAQYNINWQTTGSWLADVAATGTFTKAAGVEWPSGGSGIPEGWTVVEE